MPSCSNLRIVRVARAMMLSAIFAFMVQGIMVWNSQVAAAVGLMPQPAVMIGGDAHYHDPLGGNVHHHASGDAAGHVHSPADQADDDQPDRNGCVTVCSMFAASIAFPSINGIVPPHRIASDVILSRGAWPPGTGPASLIRPPRTSSIA